MPDPSPDTPSLPADALRAMNAAEYPNSETYPPRHVTPAAPGSSSPDVAALAERLRDDGLQARHHDEVLTADDACRWGGVCALLWAEDMFKAADALEAQAARITELEAAMRLVVTGGEAEHRPMWSDRSAPGFTETPQEGLDPVGCVVCYPADGDWPCDTRMDINDLRAALDGTRHPRQETP